MFPKIVNLLCALGLKKIAIIAVAQVLFPTAVAVSPIPLSQAFYFPANNANIFHETREAKTAAANLTQMVEPEKYMAPAITTEAANIISKVYNQLLAPSSIFNPKESIIPFTEAAAPAPNLDEALQELPESSDSASTSPTESVETPSTAPAIVQTAAKPAEQAKTASSTQSPIVILGGGYYYPDTSGAQSTTSSGSTGSSGTTSGSQTPPNTTPPYTPPATDTTPPVISEISISDGLYTKTNSLAVSYKVDGVDKSKTFDLVEGPNTLTITETDLADNTTTVTRQVTLDTIPPVIDIISHANNSVSNTADIVVTYTIDSGAQQTKDVHLDNKGINNVIVTAIDAAGNVGSKSINIILDTNHPPVLTAIGNQSVDEGQALTIALDAADPDTGDTITYSASNLPPGSDLTGNTFTWTPGYNRAGSYPGVTFTASDGNGGMDSEGITITVNNVADTTPPGKPTVSLEGDISVSPVTLTLNITAKDEESGIDRYRYYMGTSPGAQDTVGSTDVEQGNHIIISNLDLQYGVRYYLSACARNSAGLWSAASDPREILLVPIAAYKPPVNLSAELMSPDKIRISWQGAAGDEGGFIIERTTDIMLPFSVLDTAGPAARDYIDSQVLITENTRCYYRIRSFKSDIKSDYSSIVTFSRDEKRDFLAGLGDFEYSTFVNPYDNINSNIAISTDELSVMNGWQFNDSDNNYLYRINRVVDERDGLKDGSGKNSNSQYIGVKAGAPAGKTYYPTIDHVIYCNPSTMPPGSTVTLQLDKVNFYTTGIPEGAPVGYIYFFAQRSSDWSTVFEGSVSILKNSNLSGPLSVSATIPVTATPDAPPGEEYPYIIHVQIKGMFSGGSVHEQGISVDGARFYIKKPGVDNYECLRVPVERERTIKTGHLSWSAGKYDLYQIARYNDWADNTEDGNALIPQLKRFNPNIKLYLYEAAGSITDERESNYKEPRFLASPLSFSWVLENNLDDDWLFSYKEEISDKDDPRPLYKHYRDASRVSENHLNYYVQTSYSYHYITRVSEPTYQSAWKEAAYTKAVRHKYDGIFFDTLEAFVPKSTKFTTYNDYVVAPHDIQDFEGNVFPHLRDGGLETAQNSCTSHYTTYPGICMLNPAWDPSDPNNDQAHGFPAGFDPAKFTHKNTAATTADFFFQEWAFFKHWPTDGIDQIHYNADYISYWLKSLEDMDMVEVWNKDLPTNLKKKIFQLVHGVNRDIDPAVSLQNPPGADNLDLYETGWARFGFTSFLLGANTYAWLGINDLEDKFYVQDFPLTARLGYPLEVRKILYLGVEYEKDDPALDSDDKKLTQVRRYSNGIVVVNAHPSEEKDFMVAVNCCDEFERDIPAGTALKLSPHTGRILFYK